MGPTVRKQLPRNQEIASYAEAGEELDSAFDTISGEYTLIDPSEQRSSVRLPSSSELDEWSGAGDELDSAFDTISGENRQIVEDYAGSSDAIVSFESKEPPQELTPQPPDGEEEDFDFDFDMHTPVSFGEALAPTWSDCHPQDCVCDIPRRIELCASIAVVLNAFSGSASERIREDIFELRNLQEAVDALDVGATEERGVLEARLLAAIKAIEASQRSIDAKISMAWLRGPFLEAKLERRIYADYFHATVQRADMSPEWWERVTALAVACASRHQNDASLLILAETTMAKTWDRLLPKSRMESQSIGASVSFFVDAIGRLESLEEPSELFTSGLYLDVVGYEVSLREALFRPEILYACVNFHVALHNWVQADKKNRILGASIHHEITLVYAEVRKIFRTQFEDADAIARLTARLRGEDAQPQVAPKSENRYDPKLLKVKRERRQRRFRRVTGALAIGLFLLVGIPLATSMRGESSRDLQKMSTRAAASLHPMLISASKSEPASLLVANIDPDQWSLLSKEQRKQVAGKLMSAFRIGGSLNALVYNGHAIALHMTDGKLTYLE